MAPVITLTTDFGTNDAYAASLKGAILSINPDSHIIDISHDIEPQNIRQAAFLIHTVHSSFPAGTMHLVIVDPGVGGVRRAVALRTPEAFFIAPDNGVLSYIIDEYCSGLIQDGTMQDNGTSASTICSQLYAVSLIRQQYWRNPVSPVFHGRDIFAPVAAHLSLGTSLEELGERITELQTLALPHTITGADGSIEGCIIHIDTFGNLVTNIKTAQIAGADYIVSIHRCPVKGINNYYAEMEGLGAVAGSNGYLEISCRNGSAQKQLNAVVGDKVYVTPV